MADAPAIPLGMLNMLRWFEAGPRGYAEAMEHWRSTCPRLSLWEDALVDGLIEPLPHPGPAASARVALSAKGRALLAAAAAPPA
jgi:hypothetical protein